MPLARRNRKEFQILAELRVHEAGLLLKNGAEQGAYYLGGFAVECALKACIAKQTEQHEFPPDRKYTDKAYSHDLKELLKLAGLGDRLVADMVGKPGLGASWNVVKDWSVESRYETSGLKAMEMYNAVTSPDGVLRWLRLHW